MPTDDTPRPPRTPPRRRLMLLGLAAALLALPVTQAAFARVGRVALPEKGLPGRPDYGPGVLDQDELERCVLLEREINRGADAMDAEEAAILARRNDLERTSKEIDGKEAALDRTDRAAIGRHNRLVEQQRADAHAFNARVSAFNARVARHNARLGEFNAGCAGNRFYDGDMREVRARLLLD